MAKIHDRQAIIIRPEDEKDLLDAETPAKKTFKLLKPLPASEMEMFRIDRRFNKTKSPDVTADLMAKIDSSLADIQPDWLNTTIFK